MPAVNSMGVEVESLSFLMGKSEVQSCGRADEDSDIRYEPRPCTDIEDKRNKIMLQLEEAIGMMSDLATSRRVDDDVKISAASALSELSRTWEGISRGKEKEERMAKPIKNHQNELRMELATKITEEVIKSESKESRVTW